jgi:hypothetical protein
VVCDVEGPIPIEAQLVEAKPKSLCQITEGLCREDKHERFLHCGIIRSVAGCFTKTTRACGPGETM